MNTAKYRMARALSFLPDKAYLSLMYYMKFKKKLNWKNPKSFTEKLQWLKVYGRKPIQSTIVDKYDGKQYIADRVGEKYIVPTLGVWDSFDEIDFDQLPDQFVLKCTHDSGSVIICQDKSKLDMANAREILEKGLKRNLYWLSREWPYKNVKPRIIAEAFLANSDASPLAELKLFCFDGEVKIVLVCQGTAHATDGSRTNDFYDADLNHLPVYCMNPHAKERFAFPDNLSELYEAAQILSKGWPHMRVDSYIVDGKFYIGELTFFHCSGLRKYEPVEWDYKFGELIQLPGKE